MKPRITRIDADIASFIGICNPDAMNISICNAINEYKPPTTKMHEI